IMLQPDLDAVECQALPYLGRVIEVGRTRVLTDNLFGSSRSPRVVRGIRNLRSLRRNMVMSVNQKPNDKSGGSSRRKGGEVADPVRSTSRDPGSTRDPRSDAGVEQFTPHVIFDLYARLSNENKLAFLRLVGSASTAEALVALADALPITEKS